MAESNDIPNGSYSLVLGKSFDPPAKGRKNEPPPTQFHTLRYDFKPSSVSANSETYIAYGNSGDVHVAVPNDGDSMTVFKGSKKEAKPKECLLFFDKKTGTVRLEKISSQINVKKTRDLDPGTDLALRRGIERLRTASPPGEKAEKAEKSEKSEKSAHKSQKNRNLPVSSDSSSDSEEESSDSDKDSSDDDDESALLEQMKQQGSTTTSSSAGHQQHQQQQQQHYQEPVYTAPPVYKPPPPPPQMTSSSSHQKASSSSNRDKGDSAKYGLALSESSEEDD